MKYKLVIFDLDGTLLDTIDDLSTAVNHAMQLKGFPLHTRDEYMRMVGHGAHNLIRQALPDGHKDDDMVEAAYNDFRAYYTAHIDVHTKPFPGIQDLMTTLHHEGVLLAVASNKFQEGTEHLIKEFFPDIPFVAIMGSRPGFPYKPNPEIVEEVLNKAGIKKKEAVMVGDSDTDMETAANGGIEGIAVNWGYRNMKDLADKLLALRPFDKLRAQGPQSLTVANSAEELLKMLIL